MVLSELDVSTYSFKGSDSNESSIEERNSELEDVRAEFQQFKFHLIVDNEEISLYKDDQDHERTVTESQIEQE